MRSGFHPLIPIQGFFTLHQGTPTLLPSVRAALKGQREASTERRAAAVVRSDDYILVVFLFTS